MELREWRLGMDWQQTQYRPPLGFPQYWRDEETGQLQKAVLAYLGYMAGEFLIPPTPGQIDLLRDYLVHYISAPCWASDPVVLAGLRRRAADIETVEDINNLLGDCLEIGLDPL